MDVKTKKQEKKTLNSSVSGGEEAGGPSDRVSGSGLCDQRGKK